ncbi:MAG TPA: hypothetical protein VHZ95_08505, partial [Polyangiales bacterium]|nr:hypothetical protein [Polyangiales bacterium]
RHGRKHERPRAYDLPKRSSFAAVGQERLDKIAALLNNQPPPQVPRLLDARRRGSVGVLRGRARNLARSGKGSCPIGRGQRMTIATPFM